MIYLDNAATTPVHPEVLDAMLPFLTEHFGNPSSIHQYGRVARGAVDKARAAIAALIDCHESEVIFVSGGTEANHNALLGSVLAREGTKHVITTAIEHHAVLHTCDFLKTFGVDVTIVPPASNGIVEAEAIVAAIRPETVSVSVMHVNNETGAIQPIEDIARVVKAVRPDILVHSDMVQALSTIRIHLRDSNIDLATFSGHKIHGPKGIGALFVRKGTPWSPVIHGGAQERKRRGGTENVPGIVGFGAAAERLYKNWDAHVAHIDQVRNVFYEELVRGTSAPTLSTGTNGTTEATRTSGPTASKDAGTLVRVNTPDASVPTILNVAFAGTRNDTLLMKLDMMGVAAAAGSACTAGSLQPSHVLLACGMLPEQIHQAVRFSFSEMTSADDALRGAKLVNQAVEELRRGGRQHN